jgi:predicted Zn finger-like uncharacterized protein
VQTTCPQCSQGIVIDDAKIPDKPFSIKCPRCKNTVRFPGKGQAAGHPSEGPSPAPAVDELPAPPPATAAPAAPPLPAPPAPSETEPLAPIESSFSQPVAPGSAGRALVAVGERSLAGAVTIALTRLGLAVDTIEADEEAARLLEQGIYAVFVVPKATNPPGKAPTLYQRLARLSPDARRRLFVVLLSPEAKTGDATQAFVAQGDLIVNTRDAGNFDNTMRYTMLERQRLYQIFLDVRKRFEEQA